MSILSCGVIPVDESQRKVLLLRAFRYWDFPKGEMDPNEEPFACAMRELSEETGLTDVRVPPDIPAPDYYETEPYGRGKVARYYLGLVVETNIVLPVSAELGRPEHHEARWATFDEAHALLNARVQAALAWAVGIIDGR